MHGLNRNVNLPFLEVGFDVSFKSTCVSKLIVVMAQFNNVI